VRGRERGRAAGPGSAEPNPPGRQGGKEGFATENLSPSSPAPGYGVGLFFYYIFLPYFTPTLPPIPQSLFCV